MTNRFALRLASACALACAIAMPQAALAGTPEGKIQVKLLATGVLPDGKIDKVLTDKIGVPAGTQTQASDNWVPTLAVEYFMTPNVSVETICCLTAHHVDGAGPVKGLRLVDDILILPATVTVKYHLTGLGAIKPYIGAGPSYFLVLDSKVGPGAVSGLGAASAKVKSKFGAALQAGIDIALNDKGLGFSLDAKRYFMRPVASFYAANGTEALSTRHKLDPWVVSAGIAYRF